MWNELKRLGFISYDNAITPSPWTTPAHTSIFTGLYSIVLTTGLVMTITRVTLYSLLVLTLSGTRAAISFLASLFTGFLATIYIVHK